MQTSGATDGALTLSKFNFSGSTPTDRLQQNEVYQMAFDFRRSQQPGAGCRCGHLPECHSTGNSSRGGAQDPFANNVYIAYASIDIEPANPNPFSGQATTRTGPNWLVSSDGGNSFSGETIANRGGNFGRPAARFAPATGAINQQPFRPGYRRLG